MQDKNRKVVTRNGRQVRIVWWELKCNTPIIAAIQWNQEREDAYCYDTEGRCANNVGELDLFFADDDELTGFQNKLFSVISEVWQNYMLGREIDFAETVKEYSSELLDLARKEIEKEYRLCNKDDGDWEAGWNSCHKDLIQNLPKWKKDYFHNITWVVDGTLYYNGYYIDIKELIEKLPKEE